MDKEEKDYFYKKMRASLLGEPSLVSHSKVIDLCKQFFQYGLDYDDKKKRS